MLQSSAPINLSEVKTEFGGGQTQSYYRRGNGAVANHSNNIAIPTSLPIDLLDFLGGSKNFNSAGGTTWTSAESNVGTDTYFGVNRGLFPGGGFLNSLGTRGSYYQVGKSYSDTTTTNIDGVIDYVDNYTGAYGVWVIMSGDVRGTWWTSITANGTTLNRSAADATNGIYPGGSYTQTYWTWTSGAFGFGSATNFSIQLTL